MSGTKSVEQKLYSIALDTVDAGVEGEEYEGKGRKPALPENVTSGMLYRDVVQIAWPSLVELALTQLTAMADLMMVGKLGPWAIAAVGLTTQPKFLLMMLFLAMSVGATAMVARSKGAGEPEKANLYMRQALLLSTVLTVPVSILGFVGSEWMVRMMGATDALSLAGGTVYLQIQMAGFVFLAITVTITATLRGVGDSRTAMIYNVVANVVNVIFNYLFIYGNFGFPRLEVAGASLATIIGQFVACVLGMLSILSGKGYLHLRWADGFRPDWEAIAVIAKIGLPNMLEQLVMRVGIIIYSRMLASLGTVAYATHQICMNIQAMSYMIGQAFAVSATSLVGQSLGKIRVDMAMHYTDRTRRVGLIVSILLGLTFFFLGGPITALYSEEPEIIAQGALILRVMAFLLPIASSQFILSGALRGAGDTRSVAIIMLITVMILRPVLAGVAIYILDWKLLGGWLAFAFDQAVRSLFVALWYNSGRWKRIKI